jgi:hypothetical protein
MVSTGAGYHVGGGIAMQKAPWTVEQVAALNARQKCGWVHPYTCGSGKRTDERHLDGKGVLVATPDGWKCPYCDYKQDWY